MSYGKYGFKNGQGNANIDSFAGRAWNDPWFALGELLAKGYNKNYEDRGTNKAINEANDLMSNKVNSTDQAAVQGKIDAYNNANGPESQGLAINPQNPQLPQVDVNAASLDRSSLNPGLLSGSLLARSDAQTQAMSDGTVATPANFYSGQLEKMAKDNRLANWDPDATMAALNKVAQKYNLSPEQKATMLDSIMPTFNQRQKQAGEATIADLVKNYDFSKGYSPEAIQKLAKLYTFNPAAAELMGRNMVTGREAWNSDQSSKKMQEQYVLGQKGADNNLWRSKELNKSNADLRIETETRARAQRYKEAIAMGYSPDDAKSIAMGGGSRNSPKSDALARYKVLLDEVDRFRNNTSNDGKEFPMQQQLDALRAELFPNANKAESNDIKYTGPVMDNYNVAIKDWTNALTRNVDGGTGKWSKEKMISLAKQKYGDNAENIIKNTNWSAFGF